MPCVNSSGVQGHDKKKTAILVFRNYFVEGRNSPAWNETDLCFKNQDVNNDICNYYDSDVEAAVLEPQQREQIRKGGATRRAIMCSVMWLLRLLTTCCLVYLSASDSHTDLPQITDSASTKSTTAAKRSVPTDAPMLNYIFDAHSTLNKHQHHHDHRWGPHFEGESKNMTVQAGGRAMLDCRISLLQDKTVSWVRRQDNGEKVNLLTVGPLKYVGDPRYTVKFQYPDNWRLQIEPVNSSDEGQYECQVSTHPPKYIHVNLHINAPSVQIVDALGDPLRDKYYEADSTIELLCVVRHIAMQVQYSVVQWLHGNRVLNYDTTRGGISVKTDLMEEGANSTLSIARVGPGDSGNYTCHLTTMPDQPATIHVHVLNGESLAELHHGGAEAVGMSCACRSLLLLLSVLHGRIQQVLR